MHQYPGRSSQIYTQASSKRVTLFSYVHLKFLLDYLPEKSLTDLWRVAGTLTPSSNAKIYWNAVDTTVIHLTGQTDDALTRYKQHEINRATIIGEEGIVYWQSVMSTCQTLSREQAIQRLIAAEKIEQKVSMTQKTVAGFRETYG